MSHYSEYLITNVIQINPQFSKSKKLQEYENAKERRNKARQKLIDFDLDIKNQLPEVTDIIPEDWTEKSKRYELVLQRNFREDLRSKLVSDLEAFEKELAELKKTFQYDRKNSAKVYGRTLTGRSRKKIIHRIHFMYRKWREKPHAAKFLWYTFTFTGWLDFRAYNPQLDDITIANEFKRFLEALKRDYGVTNYLWVAEPQTGKRKKDHFALPTNAIHFHTVLIQPNDMYLHVQTVNYLWLRHLQKIGARTLSPERLQKNKEELLKHFGQRCFDMLLANDCGVFQCMLHRSDKYIFERDQHQFVLASACLLNPVDAEPIHDPKKLATYVAKYVTKNSTTDDKREDENDNDNLPPRPVYINPWYCTREISKIRTVSALAFDLIDYEMELTPHIHKTFVITKQLNGNRMDHVSTETFDGFPPDVASSKHNEIPEVNPVAKEYRPYKKLYYYVRMILKETVFELQYFKNLMGDFMKQKLTLFDGKGLSLT